MNSTKRDEVEPLPALAVPLACLAASLLLRAAFWFQRSYNRDDFYFAHLGWLRSTDLRPAVDYYVPSFMPLAELWAPVFRWLPPPFAALDAARALVLAAGVILLYLVYAIARHLSSSAMWGVTAAVVASSEAFFTSRIADVRTDAFSAIALTAAILVLLRRDDLRGAAYAGLLAGCAATLSIKLIFALPVIAIAAAARAPGRRFVALLVTGLCQGIIPVAYAGWRLIADGQRVMAGIIGEARFAAAQESANKVAFISSVFTASPLVWIAVIGGAIASVARGRIAYVAFVVAFLSILLAINPFLFPYLMLIVTPLVAPFVGGFATIFRDDRRRAITAGVICVLVTLTTLPAATRPIRETNEEQRRFVNWVLDATAPDETLFDWQGMHVGRRGPYHWYIFSGLVKRYQGGWYSAADEWRRSRVTLIIPTYRLAWLTPRDRQYLQSHYVSIAPCALAPGHVVRRDAPETAIDVAVPGDYRIVPSGEEIVIDGQPARDRVRLGAGLHTVAVKNDAAIIFTTPLREAAGPPPCPATSLLFGF